MRLEEKERSWKATTSCGGAHISTAKKKREDPSGGERKHLTTWAKRGGEKIVHLPGLKRARGRFRATKGVQTGGRGKARSPPPERRLPGPRKPTPKFLFTGVPKVPITSFGRGGGKPLPPFLDRRVLSQGREGSSEVPQPRMRIALSIK